jgi:phosphoribosyl 1,2-cyclic phosphate phosphodiesterase
VETPELSWVIDTGADFRTQCLREGVKKVDAAVYTHAHADHMMGFDDLRPFSRNGKTLPVYGSGHTLESIAGAFSFAFDPQKRFPGYLHPEPRVVEGEFTLGSVSMLPLALPHGRTTSLGYLMSVGGEPLFAYLTDCKSVPEDVEHAVAGVQCLVLDALREREHPTHQSIWEAVAVSERVKARQTFLTHLCHEHLHADLEARLPEGVKVAYDGLVLEF